MMAECPWPDCKFRNIVPLEYPAPWHQGCHHEAAAEALKARASRSPAPDEDEGSLDSLLAFMLGEASVHFMSQPEGMHVVMPDQELAEMSRVYAGKIFSWFRDRSPARPEPAPDDDSLAVDDLTRNVERFDSCEHCNDETRPSDNPLLKHRFCSDECEECEHADLPEGQDGCANICGKGEPAPAASAVDRLIQVIEERPKGHDTNCVKIERNHCRCGYLDLEDAIAAVKANRGDSDAS